MTAAIEKELIAEMEQMDIVDAHEHLPPEKERTGSPVDVLTLFSHYTRTDLVTAGMSLDWRDRISDTSIPLAERWPVFWPHYRNMRYTGYARAAHLALKEFYGFDEITEENYHAISDVMQEQNTPGIYYRILRDKCRIRCCLTQIGRVPEENRDLLVPLLPGAPLSDLGSGPQTQAVLDAGAGTLAEYREWVGARMDEYRAQGVVGLKFTCEAVPEVDPGVAERLLGRLKHASPRQRASAEFQPLRHALRHELWDVAGERGMVIAVHCGIIWSNWNDCVPIDPRHMVPICLRHRGTKFDLYHAGMPWVRHMGVLAKALPNVWLNLCWTHVISPEMTVSLLDEWMDLVPTNKILGFGGDYSKPVEKVWGHLVLARRDIARVLAKRVAEGVMSRAEAVRIARQWLDENPRELYGLEG